MIDKYKMTLTNIYIKILKKIFLMHALSF